MFYNFLSATDSASQSNTVEMYGTHDGSFFQDDAKSYSTYEKGLDEDYAKHYDDDDDDDDIDHIKRGAKNTYLTDDPLPPNGPTPWAKVEGTSPYLLSICLLCLAAKRLFLYNQSYSLD